jgi:hypothetical protein
MICVDDRPVAALPALRTKRADAVPRMSIGSLEGAPAIFCSAQRSLSERNVIDGRDQQGEPDYDPIA